MLDLEIARKAIKNIKVPTKIYPLYNNTLSNLDAHADIILPITRACLRMEAYRRHCLRLFHGQRNRALSAQDKL